MVLVNVPLPPEPDDDEEDGEVIALDLFADVSLEGVTSGADATAWDPIRIEREQSTESQDDVLDTSGLSSGKSGSSGVTSGSDPTSWDPLRVDKEQKRESDDDVLDPTGAPGSASGITSGNDQIPPDVKSSERRRRQPD